MTWQYFPETFHSPQIVRVIQILLQIFKRFDLLIELVHFFLDLDVRFRSGLLNPESESDHSGVPGVLEFLYTL